jgi:N-acyl-D-aspartate/D-glutamate deacylase
MHDIVIRGGTIIDGTGKAAFTGDIAIADGRIAGVGGKQGPARREIDTTGLMVTPGWVDVHTHYDGQAMWDPLLCSLMLAWRDNPYVWELWRGLCTGEKASSPGPDGFDGRR